MALDVPYINFSLLWEIKWSEFRELSERKIEKSFSTAHNSVVLFWSVEMTATYRDIDADKFGLYVYYRDGPMPTLKKMNFKIAFMKPENPNLAARRFVGDSGRFNRGKGLGWKGFDVRNINEFQEKYGFSDDNPLLCQVTLQIPTKVFSFKYDNPFLTLDEVFSFKYDNPFLTLDESPRWMIDLFYNIDDPEKAVYSNVKLVSRDKHVFYCDKNVLGMQSKVLATMFNFPRGKNQDEYPFPKMGEDSLRAVLEYLYTSDVEFINLSTTAIIEVADAAEQYDLSTLKKSCQAVLWERPVTADDFTVEECVEIICFADLHDDFKYVKQRAMEVLAGKFQQSPIVRLFKSLGSGQQGDQLTEEFVAYSTGRVDGYFSI